jgi:hypothetical protein
MILFINAMEGLEAHRRSWEDDQATEKNGNRKPWRFPYNHIRCAHLGIIMPSLENQPFPGRKHERVCN